MLNLGCSIGKKPGLLVHHVAPAVVDDMSAVDDVSTVVKDDRPGILTHFGS